MTAAGWVLVTFALLAWALEMNRRFELEEQFGAMQDDRDRLLDAELDDWSRLELLLSEPDDPGVVSLALERERRAGGWGGAA